MELGCWGRGLESREGVSWVVEGWVVWPSEWGLLGEVGSLTGEGRSRCGVVRGLGGRVELGCWGRGLESREGASWVPLYNQEKS